MRKLLVDTLGATYVCNDEVRVLLAAHPEAARQGIEIKDIVAGTVKRISAESQNKFVVYDSNIISYYMHSDSYINVAKSRYAPVFVINIRILEEKLEERIINRGVNVEQILADLPQQILDYQKAIQDIKPDWIIENTGDNAESKTLVAHLSKLLRLYT